jgi:hypothetical protein
MVKRYGVDAINRPDHMPMPILFRSSINENEAFNRIERCIHASGDFDGYLNVAADDRDFSLSRSRSMHADEFQAHLSEALRDVWNAARFWVVFERREEQRDVDINEMRRGAIQLTRGYNNVIVVTLSLLGRDHGSDDLELLFVCFTEDFQRRNFRVRFEGKAVDI